MSVRTRFSTKHDKYNVSVEIDRGVISFVEFNEIDVYGCGHKPCSNGFTECLEKVFEIMSKYDKETFKELLNEIKDSKYYSYGISFLSES